MTFLENIGKGLRPLPRLLAAGALALPLAACDLDSILEVRDPAQVTPGDLDNAQSVPFLMNGALRQFYGAYSGLGDDAYLTASGSLTDELYTGDSFLTRIANDVRDLQAPLAGNVSDVAYGRFHQSRVLANRAASNIDRFDPTNDGAYAQMRAIEGYTYVTLGEGWCGSLPFSAVPAEGPLDPNTLAPATPITTAATFEAAVAIFNDAIARDPGSNLARVGLARALLNRDDANAAAAAAAVASVPTTFVFHIEHSSNEATQNSAIFSLESNGRYGISNDEGGDQRADQRAAPGDPTFLSDEGEGVLYRASRDPRVPWFDDGQAFSGSINLFGDLRHPNYDADVPVASGVEARLIEAEALLRANDVPGFLGKLNTLRANVATLMPILYPGLADDAFVLFPPVLAPLTDPGTQAGRVALLFEERAYWMHMTGHRQGDLRRLIRDYGYTQAQAFPSGINLIRGRPYGDDVAFPLPFTETNNPNFNPDQCVTNQA